MKETREKKSQQQGKEGFDVNKKAGSPIKRSKTRKSRSPLLQKIKRRKGSGKEGEV